MTGRTGTGGGPADTELDGVELSVFFARMRVGRGSSARAAGNPVVNVTAMGQNGDGYRHEGGHAHTRYPA